MAGEGTVIVKILGDAASATKAFAETELGAAKMESGLSRIGPAVLATGAAVGALAIGAGVALFKIGDDFDSAYDKIRINTGATGERLKNLEDIFKQVVSDVPTDFGKASDAVTELTQKFGEQLNTGQVAEQFLELSRITGTDLTANLEAGTSALNGFGIAIGDQSSKLDELFRVSQNTGVSFGDLAGQLTDAGPQLRALGISFDQAAALAGTLGKAGLSISDIMPALNKSLATAAKEGKSAGDVFKDTFDKIKSAPNDVAGAQVALDVFGARAGPKLAELIREGKLSYDDLLATVTNGSDTIIGAGKDTQDFAEKWELFKNRVLVALEPIALKVFNAVGQAMDVLGPKFQQIAAWFTEHLPRAIAAFQSAFAAAQPWIEKIGDGLRQFCEVLQTVLAPMFSWLSEHGEELKKVLIVVAAVIGGVLTAALAATAVAMGVAVVTVTAFSVALTGIVIAVEYVLDKTRGLREFLGDVFLTVLPKVGEAFKTAWGVAMAAVGVAVAFIRANVQVIADIIQVISDVIHGRWGKLWDGLKDAVAAGFSAVIDQLKKLPPLILEGLKDLGIGLAAAAAAIPAALALGIVKGIPALLDALIGLRGKIIDGLKALAGFLLDVGKNAIVGLVDGFIAALPAVVSWFVGLPGRIVNAIGDAAHLLNKLGQDVLKGMWEGIKFAWSAGVDFFVGLPSRITDAAGDASSWLIDVGTQVIEGLFDGIKDAVPAVFDWFAGLLGQVNDLFGYDAIIDAGKEIMGSLLSGLQAAIGDVVTFFVNLPGTILAVLGDTTTWLIDTGRNVISGLWAGIREVWAREVHFWSDLPGNILAFLTSAGSWLISTGAAIIHGLASGILSAFGEIGSTIGAIYGKVITSLGDVGRWLFNAGIDLVQGFINGIGSWIGHLIQKAKDFAGDVVGAVESALGIGSPSRVFHEIGQHTMQGFVNGLESKYGDVHRSLGGFADGLTLGVAGPKIGSTEFAMSGAGLAGIGSPTTIRGAAAYSPTYQITINGTNMTPDEVMAAVMQWEQRNSKAWRNN